MESILARIPYLRGMNSQDLRELSQATRRIECRQGDAIFHEGEPAPGIVLIVSGRVRVIRAAGDGRQQVLHEEGPGATLAEVPVFDGSGCVGTAVASEPSVVLLVPRDRLLKLIEQNPACAVAVIAVLAARLRKMATLASELSFKPVIDRLALYLLRETQRAPAATVMLPETRDQLASHIGTVREQASRALSQLARAGVVEVQGRRVVIRNFVQLQAFATSDEPDGG